jgi:zinc/manganese transport system permease protein
MFSHEFVRNAWLAGTFVALACGTIGWFVVVRGQVFAGDALSHVAFVGAIAAAAVGVDERIGLFALTLALAGVMGTLGRRAQADDVTIGTAFAWILGIGVLLLAVLATSAGGGSGITTANTLFGSIYSLSAGAADLAAAVAVAATAFVLAVARPLLLSTLDPDMATVRGVPVRLLGLGFLGALAVVTAESTQAVGALLLLGLIAAPAGAATVLTARPYAGLALSGAIAVAAMWGGLALSYEIGTLPPSPAIIGLAATAYAAAGAWRRLSQRPTRAAGAHDPPTPALSGGESG